VSTFTALVTTTPQRQTYPADDAVLVEAGKMWPHPIPLTRAFLTAAARCTPTRVVIVQTNKYRTFDAQDERETLLALIEDEVSLRKCTTHEQSSQSTSNYNSALFATHPHLNTC
jgi:hypothetical protein